MGRIVIVDDDPLLVERARLRLRNEGHRVLVRSELGGLPDLALSERIDLVVFEPALAPFNLVLDVLHTLRQTSHALLLAVSHLTDIAHCVLALDADTGFLYLRARYYDPQTGRFMQRDSLMGQRTAPVTQDRYVYVYNRPVGLVDPSGMAGEYYPDRTMSEETVVALGLGDWWYRARGTGIRIVDHSAGKGGGRLFHIHYGRFSGGYGWHFNADKGPLVQFNEKSLGQAAALLAREGIKTFGKALSRIPAPIVFRFMLDPQGPRIPEVS